jgi:hypothetical protein
VVSGLFNFLFDEQKKQNSITGKPSALINIPVKQGSRAG